MRLFRRLANMRLTKARRFAKLHIMTDLLTAEQIEARAKLAGLAMPDVCKLAEIAPSTFWRWKVGKTKPSIDVYQRLVAATEPSEAA